jgi:predicted transglutaminase-like protease
MGQQTVNRSPGGGENPGMSNRQYKEKGPQISSELKNLFVRLSMTEDDDSVDEIIEECVEEEIIEEYYEEEVIEESEGALSELTEGEKFCMELWT